MNSITTRAGLAAVAAGAFASLSAAESQPVTDLIAKIKDKDDKVRGAAWQTAGSLGAPALKPLAALMTDKDFEVARAAKHAVWQIVRHAGRPGAETEKKAVLAELALLLRDPQSAVRREALWMLSEIGDGSSVKVISGLLDDREVREDARATLERIPGTESLRALEAGLRSAPEEFRPALAQSLRARGVTVTGYPSQKLVPTRPAPGGAAKTI